MKLSPSSRISFVTILLLTLITVGVGGFSVQHSKANELRKVDLALEYVAKSAYDNPLQPVSAALYALEQSRLDITLVLLTQDRQETVINDSTLKYFGAPDLPIVEEATRRAQYIGGHSPYSLRSVLLEEGDYILALESTADIEANFQSNLGSLALFTFALDGIASLLLFIYFRRVKKREETASLERMQEFLGDASHELRTPLTVIKGYVEMLSKGQLTQESDQARAFDRVGTEIIRMENLVQDLLLLAELGESGAREVEYVELSEIIKAHSTDFMTLNPRRSVELHISRDIFIKAPRDYISRFIQNALTNIIRHTADTDAVKISLHSHGKKATLLIEDAGPGLPESAYRDDIRSLNRFDKSRSRSSGGSGLGMSIMSTIIQKVDGTFSLRKSEMGGLAIMVVLPLAKD